MNKILSLMCSAILLVPMIGGFQVSAAASEEVNFSVEQSPPVDVTLSLGKSVIDGTNFKTDLTKKLREKGLKSNEINIQALEAQEISVQDSFNWLYYGHDGAEDWVPKDGKRISSSNGGKTLYFDGYPRSGYADFLYLKNTNSGKKTFTFTVTENLIDYHAIEGAGFLFNTNLDVEKGTIKGYAIIIGQSYTNLYKINTTINNFYNTSTSGLGGKATLINSFPKLNTNSHSLKIEVDANTLNLTDNNQKIIDNYAFPEDFGVYGFGPIASHMSHGCSVRSNFTVNNLNMTAVNVKKFSEVIRMPDWKNGSERFVVNLSDNTDASFDDSQGSGEVLTRLLNEKIDYIGVGTNTNKAQSEKLIAGNNGNGTFIQSNLGYNTVVENIATYIAQKVIKKQQVTEEYVTVGSPLEFNVNPSELKSNTQTTLFPKGRWMVEHDPNFYENSTGKYLNSGIYQPNLDFILDKPGKYEVFFGDGHPTPRYIYAHRKPIAKYTISVSNLQAVINDTSYDPDAQSKEDKGIKDTLWKYKETTASSWTIGKPTSLAYGKDYVVQLSVKDGQGAWSDPVSKYITTNPNSQVPPIAEFDMPSSGFINETITTKDNSYDPSGKSISAREWTIIKGSTQVYKGPTAPTSFKSYGTGTYTVSLRVQSSSNIWSESFTRSITISSDNTAPTIVVETESKDWTNENVDIEARFNDLGGSGFDTQRFVVTNSNTAPITGWSSWDATLIRNVKLSSEGVFYLHLEAKDKQGNLSKKTVGPYKIDKTAPTINLTTNSDEKEYYDDLIINHSYSDNASGVLFATLPDGIVISPTSTLTPFIAKKNGEYKFIAVDKAGNIAEKTIKEGNIVKELELTIPIIQENLNVTIDPNMNLETPINTLRVADWRDGENNWKVKLEATQLSNGLTKMDKGTIVIKGVNSVSKVKGDKSGTIDYNTNSVIIDNGIIELASGKSERGEYNVNFKNSALKFNMNMKEVRKGSYNTQLNWTLESAPEIN